MNYRGSCHCGNVKFEAEGTIDGALSCNCSMCSRKGSLLWFGTRAEGTVRQIALEEVGKFKDGAPKYRLVIDYRFVASDGVGYGGSTTRTDVRTPPDLSAGDAIGVYYSPAKPTNSVAEHNLRIDVYALALFLPFLGLMGIGWPLFWAYRFARWRRPAS